MVSSNFSVDGLISGMNTSQIIAQLMQVQSQPMVALQTKQTQANQRLNALNKLSSLISDAANAARALARPSIAGGKVASTDTPSTSSALLKVSAGSAAEVGSFKVNVSQLATATRVMSSQSIGQAVDTSAVLTSAGLTTDPTAGTFSINGVSMTIDSSTVLSDGLDAPGANTILSKINNAGAGVTATLENDALGRPNLLKLTAADGQKIQMGSGADTSNFLGAAKLLGAPVVGKTAASVTGSAVAAGALASTTMVINGVSITTTATDSANTAQQNAESIAANINAAAATMISAVGLPNGAIVLTQTELGSEHAIEISNAGTGTGLAVGITANGTDDSVVSTSGLGSTQATETLDNARLATPVTSGQGSFTINGVTIQYDTSVDSLSAVLSRINTSTTGVTASYDPVQDRVRLTATQMGSTAIALADGTGSNFLAATGLLGAAQAPGQNAIYSIDTVNGGQPLTSSSNTVTGMVPGVTLSLLATTSSPVTVSVQADSDGTVKAVQTFIDAYNKAVSYIQDQTGYDPNTQTAGVLMGDPTASSMEATMRSIMSSIPSGLSGGKIRSFADIGITTGAIGSKVGTTSSLVLDESKLRDALASNSAVVSALFSTPATGVLQPGGTGSINNIKGNPTAAMQDGSWQITDDGTGNLSAVFTPTHGRTYAPVTGTITAGGTNSTLIPGLTLYGKATLSAGTDTIAINSQPRGIGVRLSDYLHGLSSATGTLTKAETSVQQNITDLQKQMQDMQQRLDDKETALRKKFAILETALAKLRSQGSQLSAQLQSMGA